MIGYGRLIICDVAGSGRKGGFCRSAGAQERGSDIFGELECPVKFQCGVTQNALGERTYSFYDDGL